MHIRNIITNIRLRYKHNPERLKKELNNIRTFVKKSDLYIGKKKKLYKLISSVKKSL